MTAEDMRKAGWCWTKKGWTRRPRRLPSVQARPMPPKKKPRKIRRVHEIDKATAKPVILTAEQGRADSAPIPAPEATTPAPREYAQLNDLTKQLQRPTARRRGKNAINPPWLKRKTGRTEPPKRVFHGKYGFLDAKVRKATWPCPNKPGNPPFMPVFVPPFALAISARFSRGGSR